MRLHSSIKSQSLGSKEARVSSITSTVRHVNEHPDRAYNVRIAVSTHLRYPCQCHLSIHDHCARQAIMLWQAGACLSAAALASPHVSGAAALVKSDGALRPARRPVGALRGAREAILYHILLYHITSTTSDRTGC